MVAQVAVLEQPGAFSALTLVGTRPVALARRTMTPGHD